MDKQWWYYPEHCPICGLDGELHICKKPQGDLCFRCPECTTAFDEPDEWNDPGKGYDATEVKMTNPTLEEIKQYGWGEYCVNREEAS